MQYDIATDIATVQWVIDAFPRAPGVPAGCCEDEPIFVLGLPRSGTTLVERILTSHSTLTAAGELDCFALAIAAAVRRHTGRDRLPRQDLVAHSSGVDFATLGQDYMRRARREVEAGGRFVDKMPLNYLYLRTDPACVAARENRARNATSDGRVLCDVQGAVQGCLSVFVRFG